METTISYLDGKVRRVEEARAELVSMQREKMQTLYQPLGNLPTRSEVRLMRFFDKYADLVSAGLL